MNDNIEYFERIAAEVCGLPNVEDMWMATRRIEICKARQFCMTYMKKYLKRSFIISAGKYNLDRATAMYAEKTIGNLVEANDEWGKKYLLFLNRCEEYKKMVVSSFVDLNVLISKIGWKNYIKDIKDKIDNFRMLLDTDAPENEIVANINICIDKLNELKILYDLEL